MWHWKGEMPKDGEEFERKYNEWRSERYVLEYGAGGSNAVAYRVRGHLMLGVLQLHGERRFKPRNSSAPVLDFARATCSWAEYDRRKKPLTNRKWLEGLSDEEFVDWLFSHGGDKPTLWGITMVSNDSRYAVLEWLKEERK